MPSPSVSTTDAGFTTVKWFAPVTEVGDDPNEFTAINGNVPAIAPTLTVRVADVPVASTVNDTTFRGGYEKEKAALARFLPRTPANTVALNNAERRLSD